MAVPKITTIIVCSDGSTLGNGSSGARGGWAVAAVGGPGRGCRLAGPVQRAAYRLAEGRVAPAAGPAITVTNQRSETLALAHALAHALAQVREAAGGGARCHVAVISDSLYALKCCLGEWAPKSNFDLHDITKALLAQLKKDAGVELLHRRGHQLGPADNTRRERLYWRGNRLADRWAGEQAAAQPK
jgi:ribonuclease HI